MLAPGITFYTRGKENLSVFGFDSSKENALAEQTEHPFPLPTPKAVQWSPDGQALALVDPTQGVQVVTFPAEDGQELELHSIPEAPKTTQSFLWSPKSSALVTVAPGSKGSTEHNLHVWRRSTEGFVLEASFLHPKLEKGAKVMQWTPDEKECARLLPDGTIHVLPGSDCSVGPLAELKGAKGIESFEFAPVRARGALKARVAVFVPDVRDDLQRVIGPAEVIIFEITDDGRAGEQVLEKAKTSVASGQVAELMWNSTGSALIAHCQTEVDESGQSYYGGSKLVLLSSDGEFHKDLMEGEDGIPLHNGTAVQAVAWSPTRDEFILIHGFQPSQASLFNWDERAKKVTLTKVLLEKAHRNTIRFNHFGSLVCLAGFGNLAGQVDFFGRSEEGDDEKCDWVRVSSCTANCTVSAEWAPDGRHFLTSVLFPRMRVDNGASIWRAITGTKIAGREFEELYDAQWRPEPESSIRFLDIATDEIETASKECAKQGAAAGGTEKKQAYRPPKARGEGASTVAAMMRGEVAAPDDDRRKRQPRPRPREEEPNPSPRPDEPPWGHSQDHRDRDRNHREHGTAAGEGSEQDPASPDKSAPQQPAQQAQKQPQQAPTREQREQHAQAQQQAQQQAREQQQRDREQQQLLQHQQRVAQQREAAAQAALQQQQHQHQAAAQAALHQQAQRERQQQQQAYQSRPPPPTEVPPPAAKAMQVAEAARLATAGYPGQQPGRAMTMQQQQQQQAHQAAAAYRLAAQQQQEQQRAQYFQQQAEHQRHVQQQQQQQQQQAASRVQQGIAGHGLKTPCPSSGWQYIDPKGNTQGPFTLMEMQQWHSMGYFRTELPMRCDSADRFVPFGELFPHPLIPFQSYPKRPAPGGLAGLR